jgi:hypothetical protein
LATFSIYAALTYPRKLIGLTVSFTVGADVQNKEVDMPPLHGCVQVEVDVSSGTSLWIARILNGSDVVWEHAAHQSGQTSYTSEWITLPGGHYNFTFATIGIGSLQAEITVTSKGSFW